MFHSMLDRTLDIKREREVHIISKYTLDSVRSTVDNYCSFFLFVILFGEYEEFVSSNTFNRRRFQLYLKGGKDKCKSESNRMS